MKIIKLNRRYQAFKEYGHTHAFRFDTWNRESTRVENIMKTVLGSQYTTTSGNVVARFRDWRATFGRRPNINLPRPYMISFRDESVISLVLLKMEMNDNV
jgi:hypothetical protein